MQKYCTCSNPMDFQSEMKEFLLLDPSNFCKLFYNCRLPFQSEGKGENEQLELSFLTLFSLVCKWAPSSEFVSSSIPSWQILTAHAQPFRVARDLAFCLKVPLDSLLVWASSKGSGETARMRRLAWTFAARIGDKYQIRLARPKWLADICNKITE